METLSWLHTFKPLCNELICLSLRCNNCQFVACWSLLYCQIQCFLTSVKNKVQFILLNLALNQCYTPLWAFMFYFSFIKEFWFFLSISLSFQTSLKFILFNLHKWFKISNSGVKYSINILNTIYQLKNTIKIFLIRRWIISKCNL